jgi:hypothetical protein
MATLQEYLRLLGWTAYELAKQADISYNTAKKAVDGEYIMPRSARAISRAISRATGKPLLPGDIEELFVLQS